MDFYRMVFGAGAKDKASGHKGIPSTEQLKTILDEAENVFDTVRETIIRESQKIVGEDEKANGNHMLATLFLFAVVWKLVGWCWYGVKAAYDKAGKHSPVWRMWKVAEAVMGSCSKEEADANITKLLKEIGSE